MMKKPQRKPVKRPEELKEPKLLKYMLIIAFAVFAFFFFQILRSCN